MQVNHAIILSAGKGTRMGELGKILAKPVWPFFGRTLLDLQIEFLSSQFGIKNFFVNSHHLSDQLERVLSSEITISHEEILLDQGGGILKICRDYGLWETPVLVSNADQLYFFDVTHFDNAKEKLNESRSVLFGLEVAKEDGYNQIIQENDQIVGIKKNNIVDENKFQTFSGLSLLKVKEQKYSDEVISYFDSIANFRSEKVLLEEVNSSEYYDFGKLIEYFEIVELMKNERPEKLLKLLKDDPEKFITKSGGYNFSDSEQDASPNTIFLNEGQLVRTGDNISFVRK